MITFSAFCLNTCRETYTPLKSLTLWRYTNYNIIMFTQLADSSSVGSCSQHQLRRWM